MNGRSSSLNTASQANKKNLVHFKYIRTRGVADGFLRQGLLVRVHIGAGGDFPPSWRQRNHSTGLNGVPGLNHPFTREKRRRKSLIHTEESLYNCTSRGKAKL